MKDRTPTQVLPNGAIRYEEFNESEVSQGYKYIKLADEPTEVGTALNKAFGDASFFVTFAHARIGTNNELTNADGGENIRFVVSANTEATDTWTVNGTSYTLKDQSGETYEAELKAGAIVSCFADNTNHVLNFKSGGAALNFRFKSYATEAALLLDTPPENTIGVVTTTPIGKYAFSATEPTTIDGAAVTNGDIWVVVGSASSAPFNALKKNIITVYILSCRQYTGSAWEEKTSKIFADSAWVDLRMWIYDNGTVYKTLDGYGAPMPTFNASNVSLTIEPTRSEIPGGFIFSSGSLELTGRSTLKVRLSGTTPYNTSSTNRFGISSTKGSVSSLAQTVLPGPTSETMSGVYTCDISGVTSGYFFVQIAKTATGAGSGGNIILSEAWCE